ncbi:MAG: hypothetical protein U5L04_06445 [Trueperaceae bacterium]|nr:hypothetical protein [Trueperaceae bacterium]
MADETTKNSKNGQDAATDAPLGFEERVRQEIKAMATHASGQGLELPEDTLKVEQLRSAALVKLHHELAQLVQPASPSILVLAQDPRGKRYQERASATPIIILMLIVTILSVAAFVVSQFPEEATAENISSYPEQLKDLLNNLGAVGIVYQFPGGATVDTISSSLEQLKILLERLEAAGVVSSYFVGGAPGPLKTLLSILGAAGIGASFVNLTQIHRYVRASAYDRRYDLVYVMQFAVGVLAGFVLATFLGDYVGNTLGFEYGGATLAFLGGFAAPVVYRIINGLVITLERLVVNDTEERIEAAKRSAQARARTETLANSTQSIGSLIELKASLDSKAAKAKVDEVIERILGTSITRDSVTQDSVRAVGTTKDASLSQSDNSSEDNSSEDNSSTNNGSTSNGSTNSGFEDNGLTGSDPDEDSPESDNSGDNKPAS